MIHDAAVEDGVGRSIVPPFINETILEFEMIPGERFFIVEMAELFIEMIILVVPHFYDTFFSTECITEVLANFVMLDFYKPVVEIFAIEKADPTPVIGGEDFFMLKAARQSDDRSEYKDGKSFYGCHKRGIGQIYLNPPESRKIFIS